MENNLNTYFISQHSKNNEVLRALFQTTTKKGHKIFVATSYTVKKTGKKKNM